MRVIPLAVVTSLVVTGCGQVYFDVTRADGGAPFDLGVDAFASADAPTPIDARPPSDALAPADLDPASCVSSEARCRDPWTLETCAGTVWTTQPCALGCAMTASAHCLEMVPSNVDRSLFVDGGDVSVVANTTWDTGACAPGALPGMPLRVTQLGGGEVCVVRVRDLRINADLTARGPIPLVVLAQGTISINGTLDVSAYGTLAGPGGGTGATRSASASGPGAGASGAHAGTYTDSGGGGGALCGAGGDGGGAGGFAVGGGGGPSVATNLSPLVGGSGGGAGGTGESTGLGGAGGGAVQLSALVHLRVNGQILASGGGGRGGLDGTLRDPNIGAGGGGGSGGAILLESPLVYLRGTLRASGGGGGGAASCRTSGDGGDGVDGATVAGPASGGARGPTCLGGDYGGAGGAGAADATLSGVGGATNRAFDANGGGGGGGSGGIVVRVSSARLPAGGTLSPSIEPGVQALPLLTI